MIKMRTPGLRGRRTLSGVLILLSVLITGCDLPLDDIEDIDFSEVAGGVYTGSHSALQGNTELVYAEVSVLVEQPEVTDIVLIDHRCGRGVQAEAVIDYVLAAQSLMVDTVTGATVSSNAILNAIEDALRQGLQ